VSQVRVICERWAPRTDRRWRTHTIAYTGLAPAPRLGARGLVRRRAAAPCESRRGRGV